MRRRLERDSGTGPHGGYLAVFQAREAAESARGAAALTQQTDLERRNATAALIESERGFRAVVATPTEEIPEPSLRRQTYSL